MAILLRRFLALAALIFWVGGFTFYAAVVVPVGREVLGSDLEQGIITRQVSHYLNIACGCALALFLWELAADGDRKVPRRLGRWLLWLGMAGALVILVVLHPRLDQLLDVDEHRLLDRRLFRSRHRFYLWTSTVQWGLGVAYLALSIWSWRCVDRLTGTADVRAKKCPADDLFGVAQSPKQPVSETPTL